MKKKTTLERFEEIKDLEVADEQGKTVKDILPYFCENVETALKRLEAIDNANPSEALECLEKLELLTCNIEWYKDNINTIKQVLLKVQKEHNSVNLLMQELDCKDFADLRKYARCGYEKLNKKYLKWEDLEFKENNQRIKVKLGSNIYTLDFYIGQFGKTFVLNLQHYCEAKDNIQFFNDLHLERVEE